MIINVANPPARICIGRETENAWREITAECAEWLEKCPAGLISALLLPEGEDDPFPVTLTASGTQRTWTPLAEELIFGTAKLQYFLQDAGGGIIGSSAIIRCEVGESLTSPGERPASEAPPWALQVVADCEDAADRAEAAAGSISEDGIEQAVADYLSEHPPTVTESDPTVPAWAKAATKPSYTASEVGAYALPSGGIPKSDLAAAVQTSLGKADTALQSFTETDPTVPAWAKAASKPSYTAAEVGAVPTTRTVNGKALSANITLGASDVGAIAAPSSPATGDFLVWSGTAWVAQTLSTWQGGSY